jgi:hypothetical protein
MRKIGFKADTACIYLFTIILKNSIIMILFDKTVYQNPDDAAKLGIEAIDYFGSTIVDKEFYSSTYYMSGIQVLDKILGGNHISQNELIFILASYTNAFVFLISNNKGKPKEIFGMWRDKIKDFEVEKNVMITTLDANLQSKKFAAGRGTSGGLVGGLITSAIGQMSDAITGIQLKQEEGAIFSLNFFDDNNEVHTVKFTVNKYGIDKVENFLNTHFSANTPEPIKAIKKEGCYIATTCYGDYNAKEVLVFRKYRDNVLQKYFLGRIFIKTYYLLSPTLAKKLADKPLLHNIIKTYLDKIYQKLK